MPTTNETNLEQVFSDIAYSALRDQSQALLDYLIGFEMLKQEDEGARAIGVFGFEIDKQYYYVPVFFLNGEIRGLDSIYSVQSDKFYPLTEGWVNALINRRTQTIGEADSRTNAESGVRFPNYSRLKVIPGGGGSANLKMAAETLLVKLAGDGDSIPGISFPQALNELGVMGHFKTALDNNPQLQDVVTQFYSLMDFAHTPVQTKVAAEEKPVTVISSITDDGIEGLNDTQRETLLEGGTVVVDNRPEIDKALVLSSEPKVVLINPEGGGLFDVLWADGNVEAAIIVPDGSGTDTVTVYDPKTKKHGSFDRRIIFTVRKYTELEYRGWLKEHAIAADAVRPNKTVFFLSDTGEGTTGFCVDGATDGLDGIRRYTVNDTYFMGQFSCDSAWGSRGNNGNPDTNQYKRMFIGGVNRPQSPNDCIKQILVVELGAPDPKYAGNTLVVNSQRFYALELNTFSEKSEGSEAPCDLFNSETYGRARRDVLLQDIDFGSYFTLQEALWKYASALSLWTDGPEVALRVGEETPYLMSKTAAFEHLLVDHGMGESDARMLLADVRHDPQTYFVRQSQTKIAAQLLDLPVTNDSSDGGFMSAYHKQEVPFNARTVGNAPFNREFYQYDSPFGSGGQSDGGGNNTNNNNTFSVLDKAAKTGQKDVFDASALASLIKSYRPTEMVDRFLPTIVSGMDRLGRMLFLIFWHYEDFAERYGEDDLQEFIDNLRTVFEQLGDVILFAKKKSLAGDPEHYGLSLSPSMETGE